jgi:hypothetical protein
MDPVHCSSVHFRVEVLNDHVSLKKSCGPAQPPNLQIVVNEGRRRGKEGYEHDDTVAGGY